MADVWADPRTYITIVSVVIGLAGFLWGILSFHWNRRENRLDALSKVLQPMIRAAQQFHEMNSLRRKCEMLKLSFPKDERAKEAKRRIDRMIEDYGKLTDESHEQFRLAESELAARSFRFPDRIVRQVQTAFSSLAELGRLVNEGQFDRADLQFAKYRDDYREVTKAGRGLRLADPFEWIRKRVTRKKAPPARPEWDIPEQDMRAILDLVHKRATTQAGNSFAVHPPQKLLARPEIARSDEVIPELKDSVFTVVFQDGTFRMLTLLELLFFVYNLLFIRIQMDELARVAASLARPPDQFEVTCHVSAADLMRSEMAKALLEKVTFSNISSDTLTKKEAKGHSTASP